MDKFILGFIIGGSPSTGSSLLRQILNRHSQIVCAPETHLWAKKELIQEWQSNKSKLASFLSYQMPDLGLFPFNGLNKKEIPNYSRRKLRKLIKSSPNIFDFFESFMREFFNLRPGQVYGEKTPANAINFKHILRYSRNHKKNILCVHTVRNPYDVMSSLIARGKSIPYAVGFYLYNTSKALNSFKEGGKEKVVTIRYEELVSNPESELKELLDKLSLKFEDGMLSPGKSNPKEITKIVSWKYDEAGVIGTKSIGRFHELDEKKKKDLIAIAWHLRLHSEVKYNSLEEIGKELNYDVIKPEVALTKDQESQLDSFRYNLRSNNIHFTHLNFPFTY